MDFILCLTHTLSADFSNRSKDCDNPSQIHSLAVCCMHLDYPRFRGCGTIHSCFLASLYPGLSKDSPPPEPELPDVPRYGPPRFQPDGKGQQWPSHEEANANEDRSEIITVNSPNS